MKLLFVHDHKFYQENNDFYSSGGFPKNIWHRYLEFFSSIIVVGRKLDKKNLSEELIEILEKSLHPRLRI